MSDDLLIRLNDLADARHDDLDVAAEAATRIISLAWEINDAQKRIESLEADHEKAVALVIEASIATGHADTSADLMAEVLHKVGELRAENAALRADIERLNRLRACPGCSELFDVDDLIENDYNGLDGETYQFLACEDCHRMTSPPTTDKGE